MSSHSLKPPAKYVAELAHVREVSLLGTADLAFWKDRLRTEDLAPVENDGRAQLLIIAADSKYMGVRFREVSFSVLVRRHEGGATQDGAYLVHAFNSSRLFAFVERTCFSTPYYHGTIRVEVSPSASVQLLKGKDAEFTAQMSAGASTAKREPSRSGDNGWEGPVFLPARQRRNNTQRRWFFAKLRGHTQVYPFDSSDVVTLRPSQDTPVLQWLIESGFAAKEWILRADATHAKSKTFKGSLTGSV